MRRESDETRIRLANVEHPDGASTTRGLWDRSEELFTRALGVMPGGTPAHSSIPLRSLYTSGPRSALS